MAQIINPDLTPAQFRLLWESFPFSPNLVQVVARRAVYSCRIPNQTGVWSKYGARVYYDNGSHGSGYLMVHWEDYRKVPGCQSNGYISTGVPSSEIVWDEQPEREAAEKVREAVDHWAYFCEDDSPEQLREQWGSAPQAARDKMTAAYEGLTA